MSQFWPPTLLHDDVTERGKSKNLQFEADEKKKQALSSCTELVISRPKGDSSQPKRPDETINRRARPDFSRLRPCLDIAAEPLAKRNLNFQGRRAKPFEYGVSDRDRGKESSDALFARVWRVDAWTRLAGCRTAEIL
jgi:hypothetical protein